MKRCPSCREDYDRGEVFCPLDGSRLELSSLVPKTGKPGDPLLGTTVGGRYRIVKRVGEGGMGIVYEAEHVLIEKRVALKVLRRDFTSRTDVVERFRQEAKSASRIGHPNIVDVSDFGETPTGESYFVMEMLQGQDLADVLAREGTVSPARATYIAYQSCRALGAAHTKGIVHRDIKPENIFLACHDGQQDIVKIVDFGVAKMNDIELHEQEGRKLTKTGMIFGTPEYMSPEQGQGRELDHRVDIYALGIILYELIAGRVPFEGDNFMGVLAQHANDAPRPLTEVNPGVRVSAELAAVIDKALAKDPEQRYATMEDMAGDLARAPEMPVQPLGSSSAPPALSPEAMTPAPPPPPAHRREAITMADPPPVAAPSQRNATPTQPAKYAVSDPAPRTPRRRRWWVAGAVATASAAIALAAFVLLAPQQATTGQQGAPAQAREAVAGDATQQDAPSAPEPSPSAAPAAAGAERPVPAATTESGTIAVNTAAPPAMVSVHVRTRPAGARVRVPGRGVVCERTPCRFETPPGQPLRVEAKRGRAGASAELTPNEDASVELALRAPRAARPQVKSRDAADREEAELKAAEGDLKIPDVFR